MTEQSVGQILKAINSIEAKIEQQNNVLRDLNLKVKTLESQNKQLAQMIHKLQTPAVAKTDTEQVALNKQFQASVSKSLNSIEDNSKKAIELIKANAGSGGKKRAWP
ncbi:MAG: hypothetical protein ACK5MF_12165 [Vibrio sp.]|uniref:hypothetical protein n=1 Tax=Vibrio sp. TaxID=678 RepID=UPI003A874934